MQATGILRGIFITMHVTWKRMGTLLLYIETWILLYNHQFLSLIIHIFFSSPDPVLKSTFRCGLILLATVSVCEYAHHDCASESFDLMDTYLCRHTHTLYWKLTHFDTAYICINVHTDVMDHRSILKNTAERRRNSEHNEQESLRSHIFFFFLF